MRTAHQTLLWVPAAGQAGPGAGCGVGYLSSSTRNRAAARRRWGSVPAQLPGHRLLWQLGLSTDEL